MDAPHPKVTSHFSQETQRQLDAVRDALDVRLSALEAVLADPTRGESLEGLILDLARVATEEAQAAAAKACIDAAVDADTRVAHARGAAQEAIEQERGVAAELRRALDQAQQGFANLEQEHLAQVRRMRDEVDAELSDARAAADAANDAATRNAADARRELDAAREAGASLTEERAAARLREQEWTSQLAAEKETAAGLRRELAEAGSRLERDRAAWQSDLAAERASRQSDLAVERRSLAAERASLAALQSESDASADRLTAVARDYAAIRVAHDEVTTQLSDERGATARLEQSLAGAERSLADTVAQLDAERAGSADLRRGVEQAQQDLADARAGSAADTDATRGDLDRMRRDLADASGDLATLRADLDSATSRLETLGAERDALAADLHSARELIDFQNEALATVTTSPALLPDLDALETVRSPALDATVKPSAAPRKKGAAKAPIVPPELATEEGWGPVRLANRYAFREPIAVQINGDAGLLFDLSLTGCQFVSPVAVKPNQLVKVILPAENAAIPCTGKVMWARFEARKTGQPLGYRAGVQFTKPDHSAIEAFVAARST